MLSLNPFGRLNGVPSPGSRDHLVEFIEERNLRIDEDFVFLEGRSEALVLLEPGATELLSGSSTVWALRANLKDMVSMSVRIEIVERPKHAGRDVLEAAFRLGGLDAVLGLL